MKHPSAQSPNGCNASTSVSSARHLAPPASTRPPLCPRDTCHRHIIVKTCSWLPSGTHANKCAPQSLQSAAQQPRACNMPKVTKTGRTHASKSANLTHSLTSLALKSALAGGEGVLLSPRTNRCKARPWICSGVLLWSKF